jgi:radical SAM protein with 4Fe4S-binding SPASM domain
MKLLIHAINGIGLGHLIRTLQIAKTLSSTVKDIDIVFVTNSAFPDPLIREGFKVYRLKQDTKMVLEGKIPYEMYLRANNAAIKEIISKERPDAVLMDSEFNEQLVDHCFENKIKTCFVLRSTTDQKIHYLFQNNSFHHLDLLLIPHLADEIPPAHRDLLLKHRNAFFTGPVFRSMDAAASRSHRGIFRILITFAAGSDIPENEVLFQKVSDFLEKLKTREMSIRGKKIEVLIITGPYFRSEFYDLHGFEHKNFIHDLPAKMIEADLVISPAGYNLINEIIASRTPALLIPVLRKEDLQFARAKALQDKGCAVIVEQGIWECLEQIISSKKLAEMRLSFPSIIQGNVLAAQKLAELLKEKPKVLYLRAHWLPLSERFIYDELSCLRDHAAVVLCLRHEYGHEQKFDLLFKDKFSVLWQKDYPLIAPGKSGLYEEMLEWALGEIRSRDIRILHAQFLSDAMFFLELKRRSGLPLVVSVRGYDLYANGVAQYDKVFVAADVFLARSEIMKSDLIKKGCAPKKIIVQHSGINVPDGIVLKKSLSKDIRILMAGRFVEKKGTVLGIRIFEKLCKKFNNLKLLIVGNGPLKDEVILAAQQSLVSSKITFCGEAPNTKVLELMKRCHILLHPSVTASNGDKEGIPGVLMEAMANGLFVVASDHGSIPEIVEHQKTGLLFKEGDIEDAVLKMSVAIKNINRLDVFKRNAFNKVKEGFDVVQGTAQLGSIYDGLLKKEATDPYGRYYDNYRSVLTHGRPSGFRADIHPIRGCNSFCMMCDHWRTPQQQVLSKKQILNTLSELKDLGAEEIRFHGQEPTLRKDLSELIDHAQSLGLKVALKTNCVGLTTKQCKRFGALDKMYVSIDSPVAAVHNKLRGNVRSFDDNIRVISWFKAERPGTVIESNAVVTKLNYRSLLKMPEFAAAHGISKISFVLPNNKNRKDVSSFLMGRREMKIFFFKIVPGIISACVRLNIRFDISPFFSDLVLESPAKIVSELKTSPHKFDQEIGHYLKLEYGKTFYEKYGCMGPLDHASINYDGNVFPCCVVERNEGSAVGNIQKDPFGHIWGSEKYANIRNNTVRTRGKCCDHAAFCASNFNTRKYLAQKLLQVQRPDEIAALGHLRKTAAFSFLKRVKIDEIVALKLQAVIGTALRECSFYKSKASKIRTKKGLASFGLLSKEDVRNNIHTGLISQKYAEDPALVLDRTSGTGGDIVPFAYVRGFDRYVRMVHPFLINTDWKWGERYCVLTTFHCSREKCSTNDLPYYVDRSKIPTSDDIFRDKAVLERAVSLLKEDQGALVHADPFYLCAVAFYMNRMNIKIALKGISSTYELLPPQVQRYLEKTFRCRVFDNYGCSEFGPIAFSCQKGHKHIFEDAVFVEIVDKGRYRDPDVGEIVVTSLNNPAMPLIRYRTGDLGKCMTQACTCKRMSRTMEVHGRVDQCLLLNDVLYTERDIAQFLDIPGVLLYQLTREGNEFDLKVLLEDADRSLVHQKTVRKVIEDRWMRIAGRRVSVLFVDHLTPEKSGKFKTILLKDGSGRSHGT